MESGLGKFRFDNGERVRDYSNNDRSYMRIIFGYMKFVDVETVDVVVLVVVVVDLVVVDVVLVVTVDFCVLVDGILVVILFLLSISEFTSLVGFGKSISILLSSIKFSLSLEISFTSLTTVALIISSVASGNSSTTADFKLVVELILASLQLFLYSIPITECLDRPSIHQLFPYGIFNSHNSGVHQRNSRLFPNLAVNLPPLRGSIPSSSYSKSVTRASKFLLCSLFL